MLPLTVAAPEGADASDMVDIAGSSQSIADDSAGLIRYADISRLKKRYARIVVSRATQDATIGSAVALLYGATDAVLMHDRTEVLKLGLQMKIGGVGNTFSLMWC